ncbi:hypothetical protein [Streptomyces sp. NPDC058728]|uniref:hypothetical protein n=1 Tax=Streptomyces sp. NPDC058728 TaxID=3346612 RepID=UPI0036B6FDB5
MRAPRKHRRRIAAITTAAITTAAITTAAAGTAAAGLFSAAVLLGSPLDGAGSGAGTGGRVAIEAPARPAVDGGDPAPPAGTGTVEAFGEPLP